MTAILQLRGFGVAFGENMVLRSVDLEVNTGVTTLMGPGGAGKSTLVRTIAGQNDAQPLLRTWGIARYLGGALEDSRRPFLLAQSARLMIASVLENVSIGLAARHTLTQRQQRGVVESVLRGLNLPSLADRLDARVIDLPLGQQRALTIARAVAAEEPLVLLDEPTVGLGERERDELLSLVKAEASRRAILFVTHNRQEAMAMGGRVALLVGGRIVESASADSFFGAPSTAYGRHFVATGTCYVDLSESTPTPTEAVDTPRLARAGAETSRPPSSSRLAYARVPRGLHWVRPGLLAGMPRPGLLVDTEEDLAGLFSLGLGTLVSLEETRTVPAELLSRYSIESLWLPIPDMGAPSLEEAYDLCTEIVRRTSRGSSVAVHCRAGLGRTGTILAACLIFSGYEALEALERVRCVQPRFVQSDPQIEFLSQFAAHCRAVEPRTQPSV